MPEARTFTISVHVSTNSVFAAIWIGLLPAPPPAVQSIIITHNELCQLMSESGRHRLDRMPESRKFTISELVSIATLHIGPLPTITELLPSLSSK